jgi:hypothetical protein
MRLRFTLPTAAILTLLSGAQAIAGPVVVACGPGQHAIVRDTFVRGEPITRVECVGAAYQSVAYRDPYADRDRYVRRVRSERRHRSWAKSALIIGGSAGTGAGVGAIVGGKRGALIGAALGGGAASLYEGARRR